MLKEITALRIHKLSSDLSGVEIETTTLPQPEPDQVRVDIIAAALNFPDLLMCSGQYQLKPDLPFTPGMEAAGIISACGAQVRNFQIGDEVICGARYGLIAQAANLSQESISAKPKMMGWAEAAAFRVAWHTAYVALSARGALRAGERLLVLGAAGGVGHAAIDVGKKLGAQIFATASSKEKRAFVKTAGADFVFAPDEHLADRVKEATQGQGVDIVYDPVGGELFHQALRCLGWQGRLLVIGFASGQRPQLAINYALIKGLSIIGIRAGEFGRRDPEKGRQVAQQLQRWAEAGVIKPHIGARLPLAQAKQGLALLAQRRVLGKISIMMQ